MYYDDSYSRGVRIGFSSILLLIIFVSAAALILAAIIWRPWFDEGEAPATVAEPPAAEERLAGEAGAEAPPAAEAPAEVPAGEAPAAQ